MKKIDKGQDAFQEESGETDYEYDEVRGSHGRKPKMAVLNKTKLSKYEMDDLFLGEEPVAEPSEE